MLTQLVAGDYAPVMKAVDLQRFLEGIVGSRNIKLQPFCNETVTLDDAVCSIMLENMISNAMRHGHPDDPEVWVRGLRCMREGVQRSRHLPLCKRILTLEACQRNCWGLWPRLFFSRD